jgi:hypothetical protein
MSQVRNEGPSNVSSISVEILWPTHFHGAYDLMYLPIVPKVVRGVGTCEVEEVNTKNLTVRIAYNHVTLKAVS